MNANDIRDRASSFFERLKVYAAFTVRYISDLAPNEKKIKTSII